MKRLCAYLLPYLLAAVGVAQEEAESEPEVKPGAPPPVEEIAPGIFDIKGVRLDRNTGTVTMDAEIALEGGAVEYALVHLGGKVHESLFTTSAQPYYVHIAMLLLGAKGAQPEKVERPPEQITDEFLAHAPEVKGDEIRVVVSWDEGGRRIAKPLEELVWEAPKSRAMEPGPWIYNGSALQQGKFLAQEEKSIIALIVDPTALVNNPRPNRDNDDAWEIRKEAMPPKGTPVKIELQLLNRKQQSDLQPQRIP